MRSYFFCVQYQIDPGRVNYADGIFKSNGTYEFAHNEMKRRVREQYDIPDVVAITAIAFNVLGDE